MVIIIVVAIAVGLVAWIATALAAGIGLGRIIARAECEERHSPRASRELSPLLTR